VAWLSLELFDQLQPVHNLSVHERNLLEYAALLHDTGPRRKGRKRERESAREIQRAAGLPLSLKERGAIGLLVSAHRGGDGWETRPYFGILSNDEQYIIRQLAGLLMVADALDGNHRGTVSSVNCEMTPDGIICNVQATSDCSREIAMAGERATAFERAFGKVLHIRPKQEVSVLPEDRAEGVPAGSGQPVRP
jgi:exopolyphosphatase/guanosine-5'-triphosphate,3'-diphosphate pyrophosphatase